MKQGLDYLKALFFIFKVNLERDEGAGILKKDTFDISDAISDTVQSFADFAGAQGHRLDISVEPGVRYTGDEYAVRQLVSVIVDNAIKYAEPDTD